MCFIGVSPCTYPSGNEEGYWVSEQRRFIFLKSRLVLQNIKHIQKSQNEQIFYDKNYRQKLKHLAKDTESQWIVHYLRKVSVVKSFGRKTSDEKVSD